MTWQTLFTTPKPRIAALHLLPLPGSPKYQHSIDDIMSHALTEAQRFEQAGFNAIIIENYHDIPFYPDNVAKITVASMAAITQLLKQHINIPLGINVLRNDAEASLAIAVATNAAFIRVNVHMQPMVTEQGLLSGLSHETCRLRANLGAQVLILADAQVKHSAPLVDRSFADELRDLSERGMADAIILSGARTGLSVDLKLLQMARRYTDLPLIIGSGITPENLNTLLPHADGFIVGTCLKNHIKDMATDPHCIAKFQAVGA